MAGESVGVEHLAETDHRGERTADVESSARLREEASSHPKKIHERSG
jgi:hypothetical protein